MNIAYNILSGKTQDNPIIVVVDGDKASATVCWQYSVTMCDDACSSSTTIDTECITVPISSNTSCTTSEIVSSSVTWNGQSVYYEITQLPIDCEECGTKVTTYDDVYDFWLVPSVIEDCDETSNEPKTGLLYFSYYEIVSDDCGIVSKESKTAASSFTYDCSNKTDEVVHKEVVSAVTIPGDTSQAEYILRIGYDCAPCGGGCQKNLKSIIIGNVTYDVDYALCSGASEDNAVSATVNYRIVEYDENCKKKTTNKVQVIPWAISRCTDDVNCCEDHYIISSTTISDGDLTANVALSILMKKSYDGLCGECDKIIIPTTKYCVKENSSKVYYKTYNDTWEESKDCNSAVPQGGGQIKVQFEYSAITKGDGVVISTVTGTTTKQLTIPMLIIDDCPPDGCETINGSFLYKTENEEGCNKVEYKFFQTCTANTPSTECDCNDLFYDESPSDCNCNSIIYDNEPTTDCCEDIEIDVDPTANCCDDIELDIVPNNP